MAWDYLREGVAPDPAPWNPTLSTELLAGHSAPVSFTHIFWNH